MDRAISLERRRIDLSIELPFQLGRARVDPPAHETTIAGRSARMQPQTLKVLIALHDKIGVVVTRDELVERCWDGRIVGEDVINRCISLLRRFATEAGRVRIETVPRAGYRLVESASLGSSSWKRPSIAAVVALALVVAGIAAWAWVRSPPVSQGLPPTLSVSLAPFVVQGGDPLARDVALAAPLSISKMMADSGFAVVRDEPSASPGSAQTDYVFIGQVRRSAASIDATIQLVSKRDGAVAYSHEFSAPLDRAGDLPDRIGATLAAELAWTGAEMALDPNEHLTPEIRSELMNATTLTIEEAGGLRAYQLARHAAAAAPNSAFAQLTFALQTSGSISSMPQEERVGALALGRRASDRARALAPEFGDVYLSWCGLHSPVRMIECEGRVRHALQVDSSSSFVPAVLGILLNQAGLIDESLRFARQSLANDPYKPAKLAHMIEILEASGHSDEAAKVYEEARRLWPDSARMRTARLTGLAERGDYAAIGSLTDPTADAGMVDAGPFAALLAAQRRHDLRGAQNACRGTKPKWFMERVCMTILADLGDRDGAFAIAADLYPAWHAPSGEDPDRFWLDHPDFTGTAILNGPAGRAMRGDPRFVQMMQKLGLLDYWRSGRLPDFCTKAHEPVCARIYPRRT